MSIRPMTASRDVVRRNAQSHFEQADARSKTVRNIADEERKAVTAKTAKLRALRLAKEEEDRLKSADNPPSLPKTAGSSTRSN